MKEDRQEIKDKEEKTLFRDRNRHLSNEFNGSGINEKRERDRNEIFISKRGIWRNW
jgi:hypothetical protein